MAETDDTEPMLPIEFDGPPWLVNREEEVREAIDGLKEGKVPEPALVRGAIIAAVGLVGAVVGHQLDVSWVDPAMEVYAVSAPVVLGWWIRRNVSPTPGGRHRAK